MFSPKIVASNLAKLESRLGFSLREYSLPEVEEMRNRAAALPQQDLSAMPEDIQKFATNELYRSRVDFRYWLQRHAFIINARKELAPFRELWPSQERILDALSRLEERELEREGRVKIRLLILKARQLAATVTCQALCAWFTFLNPNTQAVVASDHPDSTRHLWNVLLLMLENLPPWMRPIVDAKPKATNLHLPEIHSDIVYGAGNQNTSLSRGLTTDFAHITEVSTWLRPGLIDADLLPAFDSSQKHHSLAIFESTAFGADGWFHDHYKSTLAGGSNFESIFIPWYLRPDRAINAEGVTLTPATLALQEMVKREEGIELSKGQLAWYQRERAHYESTDDLETFLQETPSVTQDAFQIIGMKCAFPIEVRTRVRASCRAPEAVYEVDPSTAKFRKLPVEEWLLLPEAERHNGYYLVWEKFKPGAVYVCGVDASYGKADNGVIEVLRVGTKRRVDEQVAEFAGTVSPLDLAGIAWKIGMAYADRRDNYPAKMAVELNGPGIATQMELQRRGYRNFFIWRRPMRMDGKVSREFGWWTNHWTRNTLTEHVIDAVKRDDLGINSVAFAEEMGWFVNRADPRSGKKHWEHAPGKNDDRIFALAIAFEVAHWDDLANVAEERRKAEELRDMPVPEMEQLWARAEDPEDAMRKWEERVWSALDGRV